MYLSPKARIFSWKRPSGMTWSSQRMRISSQSSLSRRVCFPWGFSSPFSIKLTRLPVLALQFRHPQILRHRRQTLCSSNSRPRWTIFRLHNFFWTTSNASGSLRHRGPRLLWPTVSILMWRPSWPLSWRIPRSTCQWWPSIQPMPCRGNRRNYYVWRTRGLNRSSSRRIMQRPGRSGHRLPHPSSPARHLYGFNKYRNTSLLQT